MTLKIIEGPIQDRTVSSPPFASSSLAQFLSTEPLSLPHSTCQRQALNNITGVLKDAGSSIENIVKVNVFLTSMTNFGAMDEAYLEFFSGDYLPVSYPF